MSGPTAFPYPVYVLFTSDACTRIEQVVVDAYEAKGTEWGGLLWGRVFQHPAGGTVPVVAAATPGICRATRTSCEILPASRLAGEQELTARGMTGLRLIGDYHSHPHIGVFLSEHADVPAYWAFGHIPHWLSIVVDPWQDDFGVFARAGETTLHRVASYLASGRIARILGLTAEEPQPARASACISMEEGGQHVDRRPSHIQ